MQSMKFDLSGLSVVIAMPVRNVHDITVPTTVALVATTKLMCQYGIENDHHFHTSGTIFAARSRAVHRFLQTTANRLLWWDSDIVPKPEDLLQLLAWSTRYPVICASYTGKSDDPFFLINADPGDVNADDWGNINLKGLGLGFSCMHREVLEKLSAKAPMKKYGPKQDPIPGVFRFDEVAREGYGEWEGEDMAFFDDVRALGYTVMVDPRMEIGHVGDKTYYGRLINHILKPAVAAE